MKTIFWDLDGTLFDTQKGIIRSLRYALESIGIDEQDEAKLRRFIGPPLYDSFAREYEFDEDTIETLVQKYKERYAVKGFLEAEFYPQVKETLLSLKKQGYSLAVASSKPEVMCNKILEHFEIAQYFTEIVGGDYEKQRFSKAQVLEEALRRFQVEPSQVILIGDTKYDVNGANEVGVHCVGITYGMGTREELNKAGADAVFDTLPEVEAYLAKN